MKTSTAMQEIRKIRDANSLRHLSMSKEERSADFAKSVEWFLMAVNKNPTNESTPKE